MAISERIEAELADLRWHWDAAYEIGCFEGTWTARLRTSSQVLSAESPDELRALILADYWERQATGRQSGHGLSDDAARGAGERALRRLIDDGVI